jgi:hypothetical protein
MYLRFNIIPSYLVHKGYVFVFVVVESFWLLIYVDVVSSMLDYLPK